MSGPPQLVRAAPQPRTGPERAPEPPPTQEERRSPLRTLAGVVVSVAALAAVGIWASGQ